MEKHEHTVNKIKLKKIRIWQVSTVILGVLLIISLFRGIGFSNGAGSGQNGDVLAEKTVKFINENLLQGKGTANLEEVEESNGMYKIKLDIGGQAMESYISSDGNLLFPQAIDLTKKPEQQQPKTQAVATNLKKSDNPNVELFVMSYCPYGTQMEKGILPVVKELGDKIDFEVKFVNYAMHGEKEIAENTRQYCIQRDFNDKFLDYLGKFLESGDEKEALASVGLSESDISQCVSETDKKFDITKNLEDKSSWASGRFPKFMIHDAENQKYGVRGSPTLVINGQQAQSGRDAQSLINTLCGAFTDKPEECNTDMTSLGNPAPGFGFDTQGGSATSAGCGA